MEQNKAGQEWRKYAEQYPKLLKMWDALPLVARTLFEQQIDIFAGKYPPSPSPVEVDGPWRVDAYHEAAHPESGCSGDQVITITDGKITLYVYSNEDEEGEQKLCNLLNQLKIKLDYDRSAEEVSFYLQERIKKLEAASSGETMRWVSLTDYRSLPNDNDGRQYAIRCQESDMNKENPYIRTGWFTAEEMKEDCQGCDWYEYLSESASPSDTREEVIKPVSDYQELWDEFAEYVDDDIDSLSTFAGRTVLTDTNFKKLISRLPKTGKEEVLPFAEWVRTETVADGAPKLYHKGSGQRLTLSQLYDLYTQSLNK